MQRAIYRIIDANFNRAREATRVIEEYCRFCLDSARLSSRAKHLRHRLCETISKLPAEKLITSRDSNSDVGRSMIIPDQLSRKDLRDCFIAAAKRLPEALRALSETIQTFDPAMSQLIEELRFNAYTLEKDIILADSAAEKLKNTRLYILITAAPDDTDSKLLDLASACAHGGADCIQLRPKGLTDNRIFALAASLSTICSENRIISIINDRTDIAIAAGADGVHLGQTDLPINQARKLQTKPMIFGLSTHSTDQLNNAIEKNADYIALGPVFPTQTKPNQPTAGLQYITAATRTLKNTGIANLAIGGITLENLDSVMKTGIRTIAVCSAVTNAKNPKAQCQRFKDIILSFE